MRRGIYSSEKNKKTFGCICITWMDQTQVDILTELSRIYVKFTSVLKTSSLKTNIKQREQKI